MTIFQLPVFEADADAANRDAMSDAEIYANLETPKTVVVRLGRLRQVCEYRYDGDVTPGCGSKLVARTHRGTEIVEMLTTTCTNAGCGKSVTRQELLDYIDHSGGRDYPFHKNGRVVRVATVEDLNKQSALDSVRTAGIRECKRLIVEHGIPMKLVDVEPILGEELLTFYYLAEDRIDFRELVRELAAEFKTRIEMRQVGARDEARLVADYERCGQHCCCKNFLKVLKPVSMKSAKLQKATLDPLKISGRCGRLMCCLRYEDATYKDLKSRLPHRKTRVGTPEGVGIVIDTKILVQLVLVRLEHDDRDVAIPVEELMDPDACPTPEELKQRAEEAIRQADPLRGLSPSKVKDRTDDTKRKRRRRRGGKRTKDEQQDAFRAEARRVEAEPGDPADAPREAGDKTEDGTPTKKRRRRRRRGGKGSGEGTGQAGEQSRPPRKRPAAGGATGDKPAASGEGGDGKPKRRRRRRRRGRGGGGSEGGGGSQGGGGGQGD